MRKNYWILIFASLILLFLIGYLVNTPTAIKGGYITIALVIAGLYDSQIGLYKYDGTVNSRHIVKISLIVLLILIPSVIIGVSRPILILIGGLVIIPLLLIQIHIGADRVAVLFQIFILGCIVHLDKFISNGYYFGRTDLALHTAGVSSIIKQGSLNNIQFVSYEQNPIYHSLASLTSILGGITAYQSIIAISTICLFLIILVLHRLVTFSSSWRDAPYYYSLFVISTFPIMYFITYYIPQTLAIVFLLIIYLTYHLKSYLLLPMCGVTILTHHLTLILASPLVLVFILYHSDQNIFRKHTITPAIAMYVGAIGYWALIEKEFLYTFFVSLLNISIHSPGDSTRSIVYYGFSPPESTVITAIHSLISFDGIYYIVIASLFIIGVLDILPQVVHSRHSSVKLITLTISGSVILRTPVSFISILRLKSIYMFTFIIAIVTGIKKLTGKGNKFSILLIICCSLLFISSSFMISEDINYSSDYHEERAYSHNEVSQLSQVAEFDSAYSATLSSTHTTRRIFNPLFGRPLGNVVANTSGIYAEGFIITKEDWPSHQLRASSTSATNNREITDIFYRVDVRMAEDWYQTSVKTGNKIYSSGEVNIVSELNTSV